MYKIISHESYNDGERKDGSRFGGYPLGGHTNLLVVDLEEADIGAARRGKRRRRGEPTIKY